MFLRLFTVFISAFFMVLFTTGGVYAANNCTGATYYDSTNDTCIACPAGYDYNTDAGKTSINQCQTQCDAGTYVMPGYTQLEYLESGGNCWIDTDFLPSNAYSWTITFSNAYGLVAPVFGVREGSTYQSENYLGLVYSGSTADTKNFIIYWHRDATPHAWRSNTKIDNAKHTVNYYGLNIAPKIDNTTMTGGTTSETAFVSAIPMRIFGVKYRQGGYQVQSGVRIHDFYFHNRAHFVPVRRNSDGELGMYDTINNIFYTNDGTGSFIAGPDKINDNILSQCKNVGMGYWAPESVVNFGSGGIRNPCPVGTYSSIENATALSECVPCAGATYNPTIAATTCTACPDMYVYNTQNRKSNRDACQISCGPGTYTQPLYTKLEYLETDGNAYIDTNYYIDNNSPFKIIFRAKNGAINRGIIGARTGIDYYYATNISLSYSSSSGQWLIFSHDIDVPENAVGGWAGGNTSDKLKHTIIFNGINTPPTLDGNDMTQSYRRVMGGFVSDVPLRIFGVESPNHTYHSNSGVRIYDLDFYDRAHFVPVRRNSDNELGMYDTVNNIFYTNSGSGSFIAGPAQSDSTIESISNYCADVTPGYWAIADIVNFGTPKLRNACPAGTTTVGFGHGADEADDCGPTLHIGEHVIYMRANRQTSPALNIKMANGDIYYGNLSLTNHNLSGLHLQYSGNMYTVYDDSLVNTEREF